MMKKVVKLLKYVGLTLLTGYAILDGLYLALLFFVVPSWYSPNAYDWFAMITEAIALSILIPYFNSKQSRKERNVSDRKVK